MRDSGLVLILINLMFNVAFMCSAIVANSEFSNRKVKGFPFVDLCGFCRIEIVGWFNFVLCH